MSSDEAISQLEESLRKIKIQYDLFFNGARKLPPNEDRRRLDIAVRELMKQRIRDNGLRFRLTTLIGRYNQFQELWGRQLREREEGPTDYKRRAAALEAAATDVAPEAAAPQTRPPVTSRPSESYVRVDAGAGAADLDKLYQQVVAAQKELGKPPGMTLEQLAGTVTRQAATLREKYQAGSIGFRVETIDGKVKLKAKPIQEEL